MIVDTNLLSHLALMAGAPLILVHQACIHPWLSVGRDGHNVSENRDVDIRVTSKHQHSRSHFPQSSVRNTTHNTSSNGTHIVKHSFQLSLCPNCGAMQCCAENPTDDLMSRFDNGVGCGSVRRNSSFENSPIHMHKFPFVATELQNHFVWLGMP